MSLSPTYTGYIGSTRDAVLIIQGVLSKEFQVVHRRPHSRERADLIRLGNVFVFIEEESGIKRWTDGVAWLPSRILGRFLVYRELDRSVHGDRDEKRRKKRHSEPSVLLRSLASDSLDIGRPVSYLAPHIFQDQPYYQQPLNLPYQNQAMTLPLQLNKSTPAHYAKEDHGLIKKTLSVSTSVRGPDGKEKKQTVHLISYYSAFDVLLGRLTRPSHSNLLMMPVLPALWDAVLKSSLGGKIPIEDEANYFLDLNYQLQNMLVLMSGKPDPRKGTLPRQYPQAPNQFFQQPYGQIQHYTQPGYPSVGGKMLSVLPSPNHSEYVPQQFQYGRLSHPVKTEKKEEEGYDFSQPHQVHHTPLNQPLLATPSSDFADPQKPLHPVPPIQMPEQAPYQAESGVYFHSMPYQYYNANTGILNPAASGDQYSLGNPPANVSQPAPPQAQFSMNSGYSYTPMQQPERHVPARLKPDGSQYQAVDEHYTYTS